MHISSELRGTFPSDFVRATFVKLRRQSFLKNVAILGAGTALAQSLNLLLAPVLTRIYKPLEFGQYALFVSFLNVATVGVSLRYELGIVAVHTERKAAELAFAACLFAIPTSVLGGVILLLLIRFSILGFNALPNYSSVFMFCTLLFVGVFSVVRYWFVRQERFGCISQALIVQNGVRCLAQVVLGAVGGQIGGLLGGEILGRSAGMGQMLSSAFRRIKPLILSSNPASIAEVLRENWQFPVYSFPSSLVDGAAANICVPLLVWYYGANWGGYFSLVQRVLAVPILLISVSVADAFQARLAIYLRNEPASVKQLFRKTSLGLLWVGLVPTALLVWCGEWAIRFVFGQAWAPAGKMAAIIAPYFLAQFIVSPLSRLVFVLEGQRWKLVYDILALGGMVGVFVFSKWQNMPSMDAIRLLSAVGVFTFVVYYLVLARIVARFDGNFTAQGTREVADEVSP
jgi:O-antigen/teichoic acid export membrane protein